MQFDQYTSKMRGQEAGASAERKPSSQPVSPWSQSRQPAMNAERPQSPGPMEGRPGMAVSRERSPSQVGTDGSSPSPQRPFARSSEQRMDAKDRARSWKERRRNRNEDGQSRQDRIGASPRASREQDRRRGSTNTDRPSYGRPTYGGYR